MRRSGQASSPDRDERALPHSREIREFWDAHPVGADFVEAGEWPAFFHRYDERRERTEPHIRQEIDRLPLAGRRVLEIGTGQGREAQLMVERGAEYHGIDATPESIRRVQRRFAIHGLRYGSLQRMDASALAFRDASFDIVFSHGVLHHSPTIERAVAEVHRVLRPGGLAVVMLYHRNSINYQLSIRILRRLGIGLLFWPPSLRLVSRVTGEPIDRLQIHAEELRRQGPGYLRINNFIHRSTDGPRNVYSAVFSNREARTLFKRFDAVRLRAHLLNDRHLPGIRRVLGARTRSLLARRYGWHLWIFATR
jgi:ubiquinone/menaquinone biosynthesis C-methylase UbiE